MTKSNARGNSTQYAVSSWQRRLNAQSSAGVAQTRRGLTAAQVRRGGGGAGRGGKGFGASADSRQKKHKAQEEGAWQATVDSRQSKSQVNEDTNEKFSRQSSVDSSQTDALSEWQKKEMESFQKNVIGTQEAADLLGVTQDHIDELCKRGKIECKRLGPHSWVVWRPSVVRYHKTRQRKGMPPSKKPKLKPNTE